MSLLSINNLSHSINNRIILENINFELKKDTIACILGPSGSGKTTLLKLIAGLEKTQTGNIIINGAMNLASGLAKLGPRSGELPEQTRRPLMIGPRGAKRPRVRGWT